MQQQTSISINANSDFVASNDGSNIYIKIGDEVIVGTISSTTQLLHQLEV